MRQAAAKNVDFSRLKHPRKVTRQHPPPALVDAQNFELRMAVIRTIKGRQIEVPATQRGRSLFGDGFMKNSHE
ncbi:MAG: hypothetical protein EBX44_15585 [Betaproteobacteria bacterium]|nr:hypothetical protein [Betaproteobacteria bacterium]